VQVPADARVLQSQRAAAPGDFRGAFREVAITLADVRAGDFVVIEMSTDPEVARLVMVTLRRGAGS
jgi:hydrogenase maturation factor